MTKQALLQHLLEPPHSDHQATFGWHFFCPLQTEKNRVSEMRNVPRQPI